jgi:Fe-S-cluster containining protein
LKTGPIRASDEQPAGTRLDRILAAATLDELYALVPDPVGCDGSCWDSCGPIGYSTEEGRRMEQAGHRPANVGEPRTQLMCTALTTDHRCSIYEARPMICRLWGASEVLACPHGRCSTPDPLTPQETAVLARRANALGGLPVSPSLGAGAPPPTLVLQVSQARRAADV